MDIILASTSIYRQRLLQRLQLPFRCLAPNAPETTIEGESPAAMAGRLALAKAHSIAAANPHALVIGSDQVATIDELKIGKPGDHQTATAQLQASSGRQVRFFTGLALVYKKEEFERVHVEPFSVHFKPLSDTSIESYLLREQPYDCAGSFKCEGLGIALFDKMQGDDPTSLEGLPLISLTRLLAEAGQPVLP